MSELKSLTELRELADEADASRWHIIDECDLREMADFIQAEVDERYMRLPVDADGVPWTIGDSLDYEGEPCEVVAVSSERIFVHADSDEIGVIDWTMAGSHRHVKPRTLEDVLRDCCTEWNEHCGSDWEQGVYAKYAAEIRELMAKEGGDD